MGFAEIAYTYTTTNSTNLDGGAMAMFTGIWLFVWLALTIIAITAIWKVFSKAGQPGWKSLVPIYNGFIILKIVGRPGWWLLLYLVPFINIIVAIVVAIDLAKSFGKGELFGVVGLWFFNIIGLLILGFGSAEYKGPSVAGGSAPQKI
jgi:uncharacterized membrane protein YhaH (DUF805 family)